MPTRSFAYIDGIEAIWEPMYVDEASQLLVKRLVVVQEDELIREAIVNAALAFIPPCTNTVFATRPVTKEFYLNREN
jgi:hypothetical protein